MDRRIELARRQTDQLFAMLDPRAYYERPIAERHRLIFYLGHLEAFDWNLLRGDQISFHSSFDQLFAFGIDPVGDGLPSDQPQDWPSIEEVRKYNSRLRQTLDAIPHSDFLLNVALEHRLMHLETLAYLFHRLPYELKRHNGLPARMELKPIQPEIIEIPAGSVRLGLSRQSEEFGWDNEFESHSVNVPRFEIDRYKVTNGEYLEFVKDGGPVPAFWVQRGDEWFYRTMFEEIPLPLDWPVYVSHTAASAYAKWAGKALPTESQWQRAAEGSRAVGNLNFRQWDSSPVHAFPASASAFGAVEMIGNGWEWTSSLFEPFPGFEPFPFYPGYSATFFDGQHYVMKGASARTDVRLARPTFRNWFQPNYPYIYAGFRCVSRQ